MIVEVFVFRRQGVGALRDQGFRRVFDGLRTAVIHEAARYQSQPLLHYLRGDACVTYTPTVNIIIGILRACLLFRPRDSG